MRPRSKKLGHKTKSELKEIELIVIVTIRFVFKKRVFKKMSKLDEKLPSYTHLMFMRQSGIWPILCQSMAILAKLLDMDFKFLPVIYINFDIQTDFEVNQT